MAPILVTQRVPDPAIDLLRTAGTVDVNPEADQVWSADELRQQAIGRLAILSMLTNRIDGALLDAAPTVRIVANMAVGFDNVDLPAATARGVMITNTPGVLTETTADLAWALLLAIARRIPEADGFVRQRRWHAWGPMLLLGTDVYGKTLGIVGLGRIGQAVARRAAGFGMRILYTSRTRADRPIERSLGATAVPLHQLLREADFVSLHTPLTPETHHLIGAASLRLMKPSAYLINVARGPIVDELALADALRGGVIAGAALDVFEHEPNVPAALVGLANCVLAPHVGSATLETRTRMALIAAENIVAALAGRRPPNLVNDLQPDR